MLTQRRNQGRARELGFDLCGIAPGGRFPELRFLPEWLARGYAGEMELHVKVGDRRADIRNFLPSARSVIVTGTVYNTDGGATARAREPTERDAFNRDTRVGQDYHVVLGERLDALLDWMRGAAAGAVRRRALRRQASRAGARLRAARRPWLDRQEHLPDQPRAGFVDVPRRHRDQPRARARRARLRSVRRLHALHRRLSDRRHRRRARAGCHEVHLVSDDRSRRSIPEAQRAADWESCVWLRHLPGCVSVESRPRRRRAIRRGRRRSATVCRLRISGSAATFRSAYADQGQRDDLFAIIACDVTCDRRRQQLATRIVAEVLDQPGRVFAMRQGARCLQWSRLR